MFLEINGDLVRTEAIVRVTRGGGVHGSPAAVHIAFGGVVYIADETEAANLRETLNPSVPEHLPATAEEVRADVTGNEQSTNNGSQE